MKQLLSKFLSVFVVLSILVTPLSALPKDAEAASDLLITCDAVSINGNVWTLSGTWHAYDYPGQSNQYDVGVASPTGTYTDVSSKDVPDAFTTTQGPSKYTGEANKDDMQGTWSNQIIFNTNPASISAALYHGQVNGNEISADSTCTFVLPITLTLQKTVINDNGGTALDTAFTLSASGPTPTSGIEGNANVTNKIVTAGAYTLSESGGPAGYTASQYSCVKNGGAPLVSNALTLASGDNAVCTITNDDIATNTPPILSNVPTSVTIPELVEYNFTATATDSDIPANTLTYSLTGSVPSGASINSSTGAFSWTPDEAQGPGVYSFSVQVSDGTNNVTAPISITVTEVNVAPVANNDSATTNEDTAVTIPFANLIFNDTDSDLPANTLTITLVSGATDGTVEIVGSDVVFTPTANWNGTAGFDYTLSDGSLTDTAHVTVTVGAINDAPLLSDVPSEITIPELVEYLFTAIGSDIDVSDILTFSLVGNPLGAVIDGTTGEFAWTPTEAQGPGVYNFVVRLFDGTVNVDAPIAITVTEVNIAPVAYDASVSTPMNTDKDITLGATDGDLPENTLTFTITSEPTSGTLDLTGDQATYTPNENFVGSDSFEYQVCDQDNACDTATIEITVSNDAPIFNEEFEDTTEVEIPEEAAYSIDASATDPNENPLTYSLGVGAPAGLVVNETTGEVTWTPTEEQGVGVYSVQVITTDGASTNSHTFTITVVEVNKAPVALDQAVSTNEDVAKAITLTGSDSDIPTQSLTFAVASNPTSGTLTDLNTTTGDVTYTPNANFNGSDSFTFTVNDGEVDSTAATVSITVNPVNDAPTIVLNGSAEIAFMVGGSYTDEGAACNDVEDESPYAASVTGSFDPQTVGTYTLTYRCTDSDEATSDTVTRTITVQATPAQCADGRDNDEDGKTDFGGENPDPGCSSASDDDETDPVVPPPSNGGGSSSGSKPKTQPAGQVLGASTDICSAVDSYMRKGYNKNDKEQVKILQGFLNDYMKSGLAVDGGFGNKTESAVKAFQEARKENVLTPWKLTKPTGIFYKTSLAEAKRLMCPAEFGALPIPTDLVPWSTGIKVALTN